MALLNLYFKLIAQTPEKHPQYQQTSDLLIINFTLDILQMPIMFLIFAVPSKQHLLCISYDSFLALVTYTLKLFLMMLCLEQFILDSLMLLICFLLIAATQKAVRCISGEALLL